MSELPGSGTQTTTTLMDPVTKTVYGKIQTGLVNIIYNKLMNDEHTNPTMYKTLWLLDRAASGKYAHINTKVQNKKKI